MYIKRTSPLFVEWTTEGPCFLSPKDARTKIKAGLAVHKFIGALTHWTSLEEALELLARSGSSSSMRPSASKVLINALIDHEILRQQAEPGASAATDPGDEEPWQRWGSVAMLYHRHSRNAPYITDLDAKRAYLKKVAQGPLPRIAKNYADYPRILLPRARQRLASPFEDVLLTRRTHRDFLVQPVSLDALSTILQLTFGPQVFVDGEEFGPLYLRTSPNAGARQETETYIAAFDVAGVPPGLYHYDILGHSLELLPTKLSRHDIVEALHRQPMADTAPLICFTTAVTERVSYKYQDGRAYRLWMYDVGHTGQTFVLTATALGLGAFQTAAFSDERIEALIGLDGNSEFVTYALGCGHVAALGEIEDVSSAPLAKLSFS